MKRQLIIFSIVIVTVFVSCNKIPKTTILDELSAEELGMAIDSDERFADFYSDVRDMLEDMEPVEMAKCYGITYRELFKFMKYAEDSNYWKPKEEKWSAEWLSSNASCREKADSVVKYWRDFLDTGSLESYVKIELEKVSTEYYSYIGGVRCVDFGFKLTPLKGPIEQIRFEYEFVAKINDDGDSTNLRSLLVAGHSCISTTPFSAPTVRYWEAGSYDEKRFAGMTASQALRDYNLYIEIIELRVNGENLSNEKLGVPEVISDYIRWGLGFDNGYRLDRVYKEVIDSSFVGEDEYVRNKRFELMKKKNEKCFNFAFGD